MKAICAIAFILLLISCDNSENPSGSEYIILNNVSNNRGNISLYDYSSKSLTENFFTVNSDQSKIYAADKKGNDLVIATNFFPGKLRKIDLTTGTQVKEVTSWIEPYPYFAPAVNFHNNNVVVSNAQLLTDNTTFRFIVKIYDENLSLLDSIGEPNVGKMYATSVSNNKLFCSLTSVAGDNYIRIMDLNTHAFITSVPLSSRCTKLISVNENQLLGIQNGGFFFLDTQSLTITKSTVAPIGTEYVALNASENMLYCIVTAAQPSLVQYYMTKVNISTGEGSVVTMAPESVFPPILYDAKSKVIVTGGLKIFSRNGKVVNEVTSPPNTTTIFVK